VAVEVWSFAVTIPASTPKASPATFPLTIPPRVVREVDVLVPPGPRGEVGFAIAQAGVSVFPTAPGPFIITDNEVVRWPVDNANTSGAWQLIAFNTGSNPHTLQVRFLVDLPPDPGVAGGLVPLAPSSIGS
jgi:hypothetical protein